MSLRKTAPIGAPHATYVNEHAGWTWKVLKVNAPAKGTQAAYATWFVAAKSPMTYGSFEMGDTYIKDVMEYGVLESATDEFLAYLKS